MKKIAAIFLAMILAAACTACTGSTAPSGRSTESRAAESGKETKTEAPGTETAEGTSEGTSEAGTSEEEKTSEQAAEESIEETVLLNESGVVITAKSLNKKSLFGPELKLLIENNSGKSLTFQCSNTCINGYMVDQMLSETVADGKKANADLTFMSSVLKRCGIDTIAEMEIAFHIFDSESWDKYLDTELISLKTAAFDTYKQQYDDSGEVVYEGNNVKIVSKGISEDSILGTGLVMYIENNTSAPLTVSSRNVSVNGFMMDAMLAATVLPGKRSVSDMTFLSSSLKDNNIEKIETVDMSFHIYNSESWDTLVDTDPVTLEFK